MVVALIVIGTQASDKRSQESSQETSSGRKISARAKPERSGDAKLRVQILDRRAAEENASDVSAF